MENTDRQQPLERLQAQLAVPLERVREIAAAFQQEMTAALAGRDSSLKMLPSYLDRPTGEERGEFIAIDFGGTNVRILRVELDGAGGVTVCDRRGFSLKDPAGKYDYTTAESTAVQLFDFIAEKIAELVVPDREYPLGHTFSFPCQQTSLNQAVLLTWTKEIRAAGVEGNDIGELLQAALRRRSLTCVRPRVILNDTVGTLLAAAYTDTDTDIASICGTGHNTCYHEPCHPLTGQPMILNAESGNFNRFPLTKYDRELDRATEKPGTQLLEKTAAGRYLGELTRLIVKDFCADGYLAIAGEGVNRPYSLRGEDLAALLAQEAVSGAKVLSERWVLSHVSATDAESVALVARMVVKRSACLVAATFLGVLHHLDPELQRRHTIAVDGSLYEKMPGYAEEIKRTLQEFLGDQAVRVKVCLSKDGSGVGAAIAAARAESMKKRKA